MSQNFPFVRNDVFPSWFANRIQDFLSAAETNLRLTRKSATTVQVVPDTALAIAAVAIDGRWRFNVATVERVHPGGAKGTYVVWAVAEDTDVDNVPDPHTDHTKYTFELRITSGAAPAGAGIDVVEKIGEIDWSGAEIEAVRQTLNSVSGPMIADGALSSGGDIEWKREANGAWVPQLKKDSVTANEILDGTVGASEIADALKPSKGAVAGTEALRALGTSSATAAAGNDSRLSDERTPKDNSVTSTKIVDATIVHGDVAAANKDGAAATPSLRTLGTGAATAAAGDDSRLSDERTPKDNSVSPPKLTTATKDSLQPRGGSSDVTIAAEEIQPSSEKSIMRIFGGGTIKKIKATVDGHVITFRPSGATTWKNGTGNIILKEAKDYVQAESTLITFIYDAFTGVWRELARTN